MRLVFVSSTFKDMQFERDALSVRVAPRIDTFLSLYGENVHFGDLRWGVNTSEMDDLESSKKVLKVCLDEIDDCRPYMIVFIGERYGWIPSRDLLKEAELAKGLDVIDDDISVTNLEIEYGALLNPDFEGRILFYFRNLDLSEMSEEERKIYDSESPLHKEKLDILKQRILKMYPDYVRYYDAKYDKNSGNIVNLEPVMDMVYNDLTRIFKIDLDKYNALPNYARAMMNSHTRMEKYYKGTYRRSDLDYSLGEWKPFDDYFLAKYDEAPLMHCVCGDVGTGRKTFLACLYEDALKLNTVKIPFIVGMDEFTKGKDELINVLLNVFEDELKIPHSENYSIENLAELCKKVGKLNKVFQIFIMNTTHHIDSLIRNLETLCVDDEGCHIKNISFYISDEANEKDSSPLPFARHSRITYVDNIEDKEERINLVKSILKTKHKELPKEIINLIVSKDSGGNPLYLSLIIERLLILDHEDFQNIRNMGDGMEAISRYMSSIVEESGDDIKDISKELLKELVGRINPDLIPLLIRMTTYTDFRIENCNLIRFFKKNNLPFNEVDYSLFSHSIPSLFKDSAFSSEFLEFKCDEILEGAKELLEDLGTKELSKEIVDFVREDEELPEKLKDVYLVLAYHAFNMVDEYALHFLNIVDEFDLVYEDDYQEYLVQYIVECMKVVGDDDDFFYRSIKRMIDLVDEDKYTDYPRLAGYIYLPFLYHLEDTSKYHKWAENLVDVIHYSAMKYKKNKDNDGLFFITMTGINFFFPIINSFKWFQKEDNYELKIIKQYNAVQNVNTRKSFDRFVEMIDKFKEEDKMNAFLLYDMKDYALFNDFTNAMIYGEEEEFLEKRGDLISNLIEDVIDSDGYIFKSIQEERDLTDEEMKTDNGTSLLAVAMRVVESVYEEDDESTVIYYRLFTVLLKQYVDSGIFFNSHTGHFDALFEMISTFVSLTIVLPEANVDDLKQNLKVMMDATKYYLASNPYNYGVIESVLKLITTATYHDIDTLDAFTFIYPIARKSLIYNYDEVIYNHFVINVIQHIGSIIKYQEEADNLIIDLIIQIYLHDNFASDDAFYMIVLLGYKYLKDSERQKDKNDPFIQKYYDEFVSLAYDVSFKEFKKSFFELGKAWEEDL